MALNAPYTIRQGDIPCISSDGTLFPVNKLEVHKKGLYHQAVSIFVFDLQGRLLIQRRADDKYHCGGLWANTCCSHPHWGESHEVCASRRLGEELGFTTALTRVSGIEYSADVGGGLWEHENVVVFEAPRASASVPRAKVCICSYNCERSLMAHQQGFFTVLLG